MKREEERTCWRGSVSFALFSAATIWSRVVVAGGMRRIDKGGREMDAHSRGWRLKEEAWRATWCDVTVPCSNDHHARPCSQGF